MACDRGRILDYGRGGTVVTLQHVNFHTWHSRPLFEHDVYDGLLRRCLPDVLAARGVLCPAWEIMPTHVHLIVAEFEDLPLSVILKHVKGDTSRTFFAAFSALRTDLGGGHLWRKGYFSVAITTQHQYLATKEYICVNRASAGLLPPVPLLARDEDGFRSS